MEWPGFIGSSYTARSRNVDNQQLVNLYLERIESPTGKVPKSLMSTPGFQVFCTLPASPVRGCLAEKDRFFAVGGTSLYEVDRLGAITARVMTTLATPTTPAVTSKAPDPPLATPSAPVVTHGGTLGATLYGYKVTALNDLGETDASPEGTSAYGNATLSATNYNVVSWTAVDGATGYKLYRTTGGSTPPRLIAILQASTLSHNDIGRAGTATTPPAANTTGQPAGTTTYGYKIVARSGIGTTAASPQGTTATGSATLTSTTYNTITWAAVTHASGYDVYRTTGPGSVALIGTTDADTLELRDTGDAGTVATPPTVDSTGTSVITDDGFPVQFYSSGDTGHELLIVGGGSAYCYNLETNTLAKVLETATAGGFLGTYFVAFDAASGTLRSSESLDGRTWDAGQVYQRTIGADPFMTLIVHARQIWLMGQKTSEVWVLTGDDATRFAPYTPAFMDAGILAPLSLAIVGPSLMWLQQDVNGGGMIYRTEGYTPVRTSHHALDHAMQSYTNLADAQAWTYQEEGHSFYVLNFPTDDHTWVFDTTTGDWHERGYWNPNDMAFSVYRPQCHAWAFGGLGFGKHLVGDRASGVIAQMSTNFGTDIDGRLIRRLRRAPIPKTDGRRQFHKRVQIDFEGGLGSGNGGNNAVCTLRWSDDGGKTWSSEHEATLGAPGEYGTRVYWKQLGSSYNRVYELVITDPTPQRIAQAWIDMAPGVH